MNLFKDGLNYDENQRKLELEWLRHKIIEAIRFSKEYWMMYKENTLGITSIIDLGHKKSYIEVLFFTNEVARTYGVPLIKINSPLIRAIDFSDVYINPDIDNDGLVSPSMAIYKIREIIKRVIKTNKAYLDQQVKLIEEYYENYPIENNPYFRKIRISIPGFTIKLKIKFEDYPLKPEFFFSKSLSSIANQDDFYNTKPLLNWNSQNPLNIVELVEYLKLGVIKTVKSSDLSPNDQFLIFNNVTIPNVFYNISFKIHRGQSLGIFYGLQSTYQSDSKSATIELINAITGNRPDASGEISFFGKPIYFGARQGIEGLEYVDTSIDQKDERMTIKRAVIHRLHVKTEGGTKLDLIHTALEVTGLLNRQNERVYMLKGFDRLKFNIARSLLKNPIILVISVPFTDLDKLEVEQFNNYMEKIRKKFHVLIIINGPKEIISKCDQVIAITQKGVTVGKIKDVLSGITESGEILTVELNNPPPEVINRLFGIRRAKIIEVRKNEKYKIFSREDLDKILALLMTFIGPYLYNFQRITTSLTEFIEYTNL